MANKAKTKVELTNGIEQHKLHYFDIDDMAEGTKLSVLVIPAEGFLAGMQSFNPQLILALSLVLATVAQLERWIGHPIVVSSTKLWQAKIEKQMRETLEGEIVASASQEAVNFASAAQNPDYVTVVQGMKPN